MTDSRHEAGGPAMPGSSEPTDRQPFPPASGWAPPDSGKPPPGLAPGQPVTGLGPPGPGYPPQPSYPPPPTGNSRTGLIIAGVLALVLVLALGVVIGFVASGGGSDGEPGAITAASEAAVSSTTTPPTTTATPVPAPGIYSMSGITNACDLVDPTPLHRWSSTPDKPPYHVENPPGTLDRAGDLTCQFTYQTLSSDDAHYYQVGIELEAEFTATGAAPAYDEWKRGHTADAEPGHASGATTGLGAQGYWATWVKDQEYYGGMTYIVGVQDSNVSVKVKIAVLRQLGEPQVSLDELGAIARSQAQRALDGLKAR
ncbi:hypothetical protein [Nocardia sp. NPDC051750]|uniref:hypothetical protein n=1 Tax=Nocardia sp. NPDC051750 TaxID=3364325 RepID=UPI00378D5818